MNPTQRVIIRYGAILVVLCGLFPPWVAIFRPSGLNMTKSLGYSFILSPPDLNDNSKSPSDVEQFVHNLFGKGYGGKAYAESNVEIDFRRLLVQFFVIAVGFGAAFVLKRTP